MTVSDYQPHLIDSINQAIVTIEAHLSVPMDVAQVAAQAGYSRFHFDRLFLAMVGKTPTGYLRQRRLSEAARMLITSRLPILELALIYQFGSQEAFTRAFRRRFRLTPRAYRQRGCLKRYEGRITLKRHQVHRLTDFPGRRPELRLSQLGALAPRCARPWAVIIYPSFQPGGLALGLTAP